MSDTYLDYKIHKQVEVNEKFYKIGDIVKVVFDDFDYKEDMLFKCVKEYIGQITGFDTDFAMYVEGNWVDLDTLLSIEKVAVVKPAKSGGGTYIPISEIPDDLFGDE